MYCAKCGTQNIDRASFCSSCGVALTPAQPAPSGGSIPVASSASQLVYLRNWPRVGSYLIDGMATGVPYLGFVASIGNWIGFRRGKTIGLVAVNGRIIRENGDVSGFQHTFVRSVASTLSLLPLGAGYWTAFSDPKRQTWHDKIMHTYVVQDTPELAARPGTSSPAAKLWFWALLVGWIAFVIAIFALVLALIALFGENFPTV